MVQVRSPGVVEERIYHGVVWFLSTAFSVVPTITGSYGAKGPKSYWSTLELIGLVVARWYWIHHKSIGVGLIWMAMVASCA